jgi:hypothetical protein
MHCIAGRAAIGVAWLTLALLGGCAAVDGRSERAAADAIAAEGELVPAWEEVAGFRLLTYARGLDRGTGTVSVYLEGDGRAWRGHRPPRDPTSVDPMGLRLAALDPAPAVLWIGRPCMYQDDAMACGPRWWTSHRYAGEVVDALLDVVRRRVPARRPVSLLGHSGGGALATLMAARALRMPDLRIESLITVAAPLDLAGWTDLLALSPLTGSLDPVLASARLADLPQRHLAGQRDEVVPVAVVERFVSALPVPNRARLEVYPQHAHRCCWHEHWRTLRALSAPARLNTGN